MTTDGIIALLILLMPIYFWYFFESTKNGEKRPEI